MIFSMDYSPFPLEGKGREGGGTGLQPVLDTSGAFQRSAWLYELYDRILGKLVVMIRQPEKWVIGNKGT